MNFDFSTSSLSYDWFLLALRLAFIGLIYVFLYQVARVTIRELVRIGNVAPATGGTFSVSTTTSLEILDPADSPLTEGERLHLDYYTTIGRRSDNSVVVADSFVSGQHAEIFFEDGLWWLVDLGSTNGTFVNDRLVTGRVSIKPGDIVQFGRVITRLTT